MKTLTRSNKKSVSVLKSVHGASGLQCLNHVVCAVVKTNRPSKGWVESDATVVSTAASCGEDLGSAGDRSTGCIMGLNPLD